MKVPHQKNEDLWPSILIMGEILARVIFSMHSDSHANLLVL